MSLMALVPTNPIQAGSATPIASGSANAFRPALNTYVGSVEAKERLVQAHLEYLQASLGQGALFGGTIAPSVGLAVTVSAFGALIGNYVETNSASTVGGLTANATNYLYARQDGSFSFNTAGTIPGTADGHGTALLWGDCTTNASTVTAVNNTRQYFPKIVDAWQPKTLTASGTVDATERVILVSSTSASTVTLPAFGTVPIQQPVTVKNINTGTVSIIGQGGALIDGAGTVTLPTQWQAREFVTNGTAWYIKGGFG